MTTEKIAVRVSNSDQLVASEKRREVPFPKDLPTKLVHLQQGSKKVPGIICFRTILELFRLPDGGMLHQWKMTISPDSETMRARFFAVQNVTQFEAHPSMNHHTDNMVEVFEEAHRQLSDLGEPHPLNGTTVYMWFGYETDGTEFFRVDQSSLVGLLKESVRVTDENVRRTREARVFFPFTSWVIWTRQFRKEDFPIIPQVDAWKEKHKEAHGLLYANTFKPCLRSLWKAVYGSGVCADQLRALGFPLDRVGRSILSGSELRALIRAQDKASRRTFMFIPEKDE